MARFRLILALSFFSLCLLSVEPSYAQDEPKFGQRLLKPFQKLREKATESASSVCADCRFSGKLCPKCAERSMMKSGELAEKKAVEAEKKVTEEMQMEVAKKKLALEEKQIAFDEKKLAEEEKKLEKAKAEENKPWDVADEENLESSSELLKMAAESKQSNDLVPKKQQALNYLANLGCLKDPKVEKAIMAGLTDSHEAVRLAAVQAILNSYSGTSIPFPLAPSFGAPHQSAGCTECQGLGSSYNQVHAPCDSCGGGGCGGCNYCGQTVQVFNQPCQVCNPQPQYVGYSTDSCKKCCTKQIIAELKLMAFEQDLIRTDCFYEPSEAVRNLARQAIEECPAIIEQEDDVDIPEAPEDVDESDVDESDTETDEIQLLEDVDESDTDEDDAMDDDGLEDDLMDDDGLDDDGLDDDGLDDDGLGDDGLEADGLEADAMEDDAIEELEQPMPDGPTSDDDDFGPFDGAGFGSPSSSALQISYRKKQSKPRSSRLIPANVADFHRHLGQVIKFQDDYLIPVGSQIYLKSRSGSMYGEVVRSNVGAIVVSIENQETNLAHGEAIRVGIVKE